MGLAQQMFSRHSISWHWWSYSTQNTVQKSSWRTQHKLFIGDARWLKSQRSQRVPLRIRKRIPGAYALSVNTGCERILETACRLKENPILNKCPVYAGQDQVTKIICIKTRFMKSQQETFRVWLVRHLAIHWDLAQPAVNMTHWFVGGPSNGTTF